MFYLCTKSEDKLHLGIKNEQVHFILLSVCIIFACRKKKEIMGKLATLWDFIGRHKYGITVLAFVVIIGFLDENSMIRRGSYAREINRLQNEIERYRADYEDNTQKLNELTTNPDAIEQIAREKYLMKKPNEDIYVFKDKE